jgi:hypothetical protein
MVAQPSPQAPIPYASHHSYQQELPNHQSYPVQVNSAPTPVAQPAYAVAASQQQPSSGQQPGLQPGTQVIGNGYPGSHGGHGGEFGGPYGYKVKPEPTTTSE